MKNIFKIFFLLLVLNLSCEEEKHEPLLKDATIPGKVTEINVINLPGGAKIEYKVPDDEDVLLVEASYMLKSGEKATQKSSVYKNFVTVEGLIDVTPQDVELVTVDRSGNRSEGVTVSISPLEAPVNTLFAGLKMIPDFGGATLSYDNENEIRVEILLSVKDENGYWNYNQSAFISNDVDSTFTFRSFPDSLHVFGISLIDRWDNTTEIKEFEITPLEEVLLDPANYDHPGLLIGDQPFGFGWSYDRMWDGSIEGRGFHTTFDYPDIPAVPPYEENFHSVTIDLGVLARLSRFRLWQRQGDAYIYNHGNPRYFDVWGIDEIPADNGASMENNGWTQLIKDGEVIKPSGAPVGILSADDRTTAAAGDEFSFPIDAPPVRYVRFVTKENFIGSKFFHIMELKFWGQIQE